MLRNEDVLLMKPELRPQAKGLFWGGGGGHQPKTELIPGGGGAGGGDDGLTPRLNEPAWLKNPNL